MSGERCYNVGVILACEIFTGEIQKEVYRNGKDQ